MEIIVGKTAGFCYGVKRAVDGAKEETSKSKRVYCLGEIVHNEQVISDLESNGMEFIYDINEVEDTEVILRAHGEPKSVYDELKSKHITFYDATCINVKRVHDLVIDKYNNDYNHGSKDRSMGVNAWIGKLADGIVATV